MFGFKRRARNFRALFDRVSSLERDHERTYSRVTSTRQSVHDLRMDWVESRARLDQRVAALEKLAKATVVSVEPFGPDCITGTISVLRDGQTVVLAEYGRRGNSARVFVRDTRQLPSLDDIAKAIGITPGGTMTVVWS